MSSREKLKDAQLSRLKVKPNIKPIRFNKGIPDRSVQFNPSKIQFIIRKRRDNSGKMKA